MPLEGPDDPITLGRAAELCGLSLNGLYMRARQGRLQTMRPSGRMLTTRRWLHAYLVQAAARDRGRHKPLPEGYVAPE